MFLSLLRLPRALSVLNHAAHVAGAPGICVSAHDSRSGQRRRRWEGALHSAKPNSIGEPWEVCGEVEIIHPRFSSIRLKQRYH
jgi:hypothetical protein